MRDGQAPWALAFDPKCPGRLRHGGAPGGVHQRADAASAAGNNGAGACGADARAG